MTTTTVPALDWETFRKFRPCEEEVIRVNNEVEAAGHNWQDKPITMALAKKLGISRTDVEWCLYYMTDKDYFGDYADIRRRVRLHNADCVAYLLSKQIDTFDPGDAKLVCNAIVAAREFALDPTESTTDALDEAQGELRCRNSLMSLAYDMAQSSYVETTVGRRGRYAADQIDKSNAVAVYESWEMNRLVKRFSANEPDLVPLPDLKSE